MKSNRALATNKFSTVDGAKNRVRLLNAMAEQLNRCPTGCTKSADKWLKVKSLLLLLLQTDIDML